MALFFLTPVLLAQQNGASIAHAFEPSFMPAATLQSKVQEVDLVLSVTNHRGHFVHGLRPSDFIVLDNGKPQSDLTFFQSQTDLPLRIALLVDMSASVTQRFAAEQGTMKSFLRSVARRNDSVALFAFNQKVQLVAPFYDNWKQISHRIKKLNPKGDTALFDAICAATQWLAEDQRQARHIIIVATDGEENSSKATLSSTIAAALRSEASIYSINVNYEVGDPDAKQGEQILKALSDGTGGVYLRADQDGGVGDAFSRIRNQLRNQYALAYKPSDLLAQPFHRLLVLVPKNLRVHCRPGYYVK